MRRRLFQCLDTSAKVDMERRTTHDQSGNRLDTGGLCFFQTRFVAAQVDNLNIIFRGVKRMGYVLLGGDAHGASGVVKNRFGLHNGSPGLVSATGTPIG